ncbi:MAG: CCA tRNA nucleotidyltransferase [Bacillus subtilis]|nr:CCA tRNA nucleotidyltransferase [Bacillus subtilis]
MSAIVEAGKLILAELESHGYEAVFVGGFVRDFLLSIPPSDIDIATSATPDQVRAVFSRTKNTGEKYGTVTVFQGPLAFEVTTFRTEGTYSDQRHPDAVAFSQRLDEDLTRRDFTINALAMNRHGKIIDHVGGIADLETKTIRAIGNPHKRFEEDALRMLRAFRFVSKLDFTIEPATFSAIHRHRMALRTLPSERILQEIKAMLKYNHQAKAMLGWTEAGLDEVFPELRGGVRMLAIRNSFELDFHQFFALCFYLNDQTIPDRWRFSNKEKAIIERLMELVFVTSDDHFHPLMIYANGLDLCLLADGINRILDPTNIQTAAIVEMYQAMPIHKTCDLAFKGDDIMKLTTLRNAHVIGDVIDELIEQVITFKLPNEYEPLKEYAIARLQSHTDSEDKS